MTMRILLATDAFPPRCGGSGWSTYELARGLRARGHDVHVLQPRPNGRVDTREYDGFTVREFPFHAPDVPYVRNYAKSERLRQHLAPAIPRLRQLVEHGREGLLYEAARPDGLADALDRLTDPAVRQSLGAAARRRAVAEYSWAAHCTRLADAITEAHGARGPA